MPPPETSRLATQPGRNANARPLWIVLLILSLGCFLGLDKREIWNNAEARVLLTAQDMLSGEGSLFRPTMLGRPRYEKPPLMYWAVIGAAKLQGGMRETSGYWVSAIAAVVAAWTLALTLGAIVSRRAGALAGIMLLASPAIFTYARQSQLDMLFTAGCTIALSGFALWLFRGPAAWFALAAGGAAIAALAKGPHTLTFVFAPVAIYLLWRRRGGWRGAVGVAVALAVALAAAGAWLALALREDPAYLRKIAQVLHSASAETNIEPFYYYPDKAIIDLLPWLLLAPAVWPSKRKSADQPRPADELAKFYALAFVAGFVALSMIPGKQRHYILPLLPSALAWIVLQLDSLLESGEGAARWRRRWIAAVAIGAAAVFTVIAAGGLAGPLLEGLEPSLATRPIGITMTGFTFALIGLAWAVRSVRRAALREALGATALASVAVGVIVVSTLYPGRNLVESPKAACAQIRRMTPDLSAVRIKGSLKEVVAYYFGGKIDSADSADEIKQWMGRGKPSFLIALGTPELSQKALDSLAGADHAQVARFHDFTGYGRDLYVFANKAGQEFSKGKAE